jgi:uncharacterized membrane protein
MPGGLTAGAALAALPQVVKVGKKVFDATRDGGGMVGKAKDVVQTATDVKDAVGMESSTLGKVKAAAGQVAKHSDSGGKKKLSHLIEQHIDVAVPQAVAYAQWTQFEDFATIMKGVEGVEQQDRTKVRWRSKIGPSRREWLAKITEQTPDERISWTTAGGVQTTGVVTFHKLDRELTRVMVQMEYDPQGFVENVGNLLRIQRRRVWRDLKLFKHFLELRGEPTGASRQRVRKDSSAGPQHAGQKVPSNGQKDS